MVTSAPHSSCFLKWGRLYNKYGRNHTCDRVHGLLVEIVKILYSGTPEKKSNSFYLSESWEISQRRQQLGLALFVKRSSF